MVTGLLFSVKTTQSGQQKHETLYVLTNPCANYPRSPLPVSSWLCILGLILNKLLNNMIDDNDNNFQQIIITAACILGRHFLRYFDYFHHSVL